MQIASMSATGDGRASSGEILREDGSFLIVIDGTTGGRAGSLEAAAEQLAHELQRRLPKHPATWQVHAACSTGGLSIVAGHPSAGGGGGPLPPCAAQVLGYRRLDSLQVALAAFAKVIGHCCRRR
jgi:hypothetical protein